MITLPPSPIGSPLRCYTPSDEEADIGSPTRLPELLTPPDSGSQQDGSTPRTVSMDPERDHAQVPDLNTLSDPISPQHNMNPENDSGAVHDAIDDIVEDIPPKKATTAAFPMVLTSISIAQFARQLQLRDYLDAQRRASVLRFRGLHLSIHLSTRLRRIVTTAQRGLVESFKLHDKSAFASIYNVIHDIREACESVTGRSTLEHDPLFGLVPTSLKTGGSQGFTGKLSADSKTDLLAILTLVRTDSQFLFQCISNLTPSQLSALVSPVHSLDISSPNPSPDSSSRGQSSFLRRNVAHSSAFKDHALSFERTDPLSLLLCNVYSTTLDPNSSEARLRLDVWSSTCAKLISHGGSGMYGFVGHLLTLWSGFGEWKAKPKFELYLMDILQNGAFLLDHPGSHPADSDADFFDPMTTELAEQFFITSVQGLFAVLDDSDGGFPAAVLEIGQAIVNKLGMSESRRRFLGYIFYQWLFCQFIHTAICFPETHGLLLDFHITKDARERLLRQISLYAQGQVSHMLHSSPHYSYTIPEVKKHAERMLSHITDPIMPTADAASSTPIHSSPSNVHDYHIPAGPILLLSSADILTLLDTFFPRIPTIPPSLDIFHQNSYPSTPIASYISRSTRSSPPYSSRLLRGRFETPNAGPPTTEMSYQDATKSYFVRPRNTSVPESSGSRVTRNADRLRYELLDIREAEDRHVGVNPAYEDWAMFSVHDGTVACYLVEEAGPNPQTASENTPEYELLQHQDKVEEALVKLIQDFDVSQTDCFEQRASSNVLENNISLKRWFMHAMAKCQRGSDYIGSHYWWESSRLLGNAYATYGQPEADNKYLTPMYDTAKRSSEKGSAIIQTCEQAFINLRGKMELLQSQISDALDTVSQLRNKMWYVTDVKNSLRYEDAKNVALALKTMSLAQALQPTPETSAKGSTRSLAGSFLQKPEIQVMNYMRATRSQGGPFKLADEQVEVTRKWLQRSGIDNFCRGEERIHRFCYEVKASVSKLVGETMYDTPVLWSSELYQRERSKYESSGARPLSGSLRPSSIASEESFGQAFGMRTLDQLFRPLNDTPSLAHKLSFQSVTEDRWRSRDLHGDTSSVGDSPGKTTVSNSTTDSILPFWSPMHTHAQSITSASSLRSRPPSLFSDSQPPKRTEQNISQGKTVFLDGLRRSLTSLLLSDLGCPVWSCGSETDAWFSDCMEQKRIQNQMTQRSRMDKFLSQCRTPLAHRRESAIIRGQRQELRRTCSTPILRNSQPIKSRSETADERLQEEDNFDYDDAFKHLMEKFTRPASPFVKLEALHVMWTLVVTSLNSDTSASYTESRFPSSIDTNSRRNSVPADRKWPDHNEDQTPTPSSPGFVPSGAPSGFAINSPTHEVRITNALRDLIQKLRPRTIFRDLQFIAAFVPSEILNKTESGTAFLQFGLAALKLKDEVCNSMVEIADKIVCQELAMRQNRHLHPDFSMRAGNGIKDAANMWIITAREGNAVAQRELAILYLTHPHLLRPVTLPLTKPGDTFKAEMMYRRDRDSKSDPLNMCLALHWMQLSAAGGDELAKNRLRERAEFESLV
ncbi:hypothetical protein FQN57_002068 [Myotisia sp. PD_48]|nr:hypothetical protein FQN57_002068 [Myotisia sp. PD_48]